MANLTDVIEYLCGLTDDSLNESIHKLRTEIDRMQKLVEMLEAIQRSMGSNGAAVPAAAAKTLKARESPTPYIVPEPLPPKKEQPPAPAPAALAPAAPAPAAPAAPASSYQASLRERQLDTLYEYLSVRGDSNVTKIARELGIHHRRVGKLLLDAPDRFEEKPNGDFVAIGQARRR